MLQVYIPLREVFVNEMLSDVLHLFKGSKKVSRVIVDADNAMVDRHHFIIGWTSIFQQCYDIRSKTAAWGSVRTMSADRLNKLEHDSRQIVNSYICYRLFWFVSVIRIKSYNECHSDDVVYLRNLILLYHLV